jgi:hypothetical protein
MPIGFWFLAIFGTGALHYPSVSAGANVALSKRAGVYGALPERALALYPLTSSKINCCTVPPSDIAVLSNVRLLAL